MTTDFLEEEEVVDAEDEAEIVGTHSPRKPFHPSQSSHMHNSSHQHSKTGATPAGREEEEGKEDPKGEEEEEVGEVNSIIRHRKGKQSFHRDRQNERILDRDWGRDHTRGNIRQHTRKGLEEDQPIALLPDVDSVVRGRTLSWVYTGPSDQDLNKKAIAQGGRGDLEVPPKISKSSLLFPQKTSLSALTSRAKQILSNSAHSNYPHTNSNKPVGSKKEKREESKIYITRPRPAKEREKEREQRRERREERASRHPREVFPGVFLYQTGKTTRLVNLGQRRHGGRGGSVVRHLIGAPQLWHSPPTKDSKTSAHNKSVNIQSETAERSFNKVAMTKQLEKIKRKGESRDLRTTVTADLPSKRDIQIPLSYHQEPGPTPASETRLSYTENTIHSQLRVTSYLRTSEITESQHQLNPVSHLTDIDQDTNHSNPDPNPDPEQELEPEEGEMSDYSYEEVEVRPGWAEESINWQRTFSVNPMDFELLRSDWNDLRCNVSGNLQLAESEVVDVLAQYMEKLNEHNGG